MNGKLVNAKLFSLLFAESLRDNAEFGHYLAELSSYGVKRLCKYYVKVLLPRYL